MSRDRFSGVDAGIESGCVTGQRVENVTLRSDRRRRKGFDVEIAVAAEVEGTAAGRWGSFALRIAHDFVFGNELGPLGLGQNLGPQVAIKDAVLGAETVAKSAHDPVQPGHHAGLPRAVTFRLRNRLPILLRRKSHMMVFSGVLHSLLNCTQTMAQQDWFRNETWSEADRASFYARLKRSRTAGNKAQYLRIQATHLAGAGNDQAALGLLAEMRRDYPDPLQVVLSRNQMGRSLWAIGAVKSAR